MEARNLPQQTEEQAAQRRAAMESGLQKAVEVPLGVLRVGDGCWEAMVEMARHGNVASRSDLEVGAKALEAGLWGAYRNVLVNLPEITDTAFRTASGSEAEAIAQRARQRLEEVLTILAGR
jgi:glutamate formiminotransferase/formiminotetrahydrofolate cyclodeaminase